jgi:hypothetical protein
LTVPALPKVLAKLFAFDPESHPVRVRAEAAMVAVAHDLLSIPTLSVGDRLLVDDRRPSTEHNQFNMSESLSQRSASGEPALSKPGLPSMPLRIPTL